MNNYLGYVIGGVASLIWIYIAARMVGRAVMRELNEKQTKDKESNHGSK